MKINGYTRLAAVVARPIKHSLSPFIHNTAFEATGVNGVYVAWDIPEAELEVTVENIRRYDMFGINLSMPYKASVIPYLDEISPEAELIGAVNTVVNRDGHLVGYSTDGPGFFASLGSFDIKDKVMTIIGAGGAGLAIIAQAALLGVKHIHVFSRRTSIAKTQANLSAILAKTGVSLSVEALEDYEDLQVALDQSELLVNATSLGMDEQTNPLPKSVRLPSGLIVADIIYQPLETPLLKQARELGLETHNGLGMLLHQAALAFELWTGEEMPVDTIAIAIEEQLKKKSRS